MTRKILLTLAAVLPLIMGATAAGAAELDVVSVTRVALRAGPGPRFPVVATIPAAAPLVLHGCTTGYGWCDISWGAERGWLAATSLSTIYRAAPVAITAATAARLGVAIVAFDAGYWHRYYIGRPWYRRWRWYWR
jgi:uncharacterized protein YraI